MQKKKKSTEALFYDCIESGFNIQQICTVLLCSWSAQRMSIKQNLLTVENKSVLCIITNCIVALIIIVVFLADFNYTACTFQAFPSSGCPLVYFPRFCSDAH